MLELGGRKLLRGGLPDPHDPLLRVLRTEVGQRAQRELRDRVARFGLGARGGERARHVRVGRVACDVRRNDKHGDESGT